MKRYLKHSLLTVLSVLVMTGAVRAQVDAVPDPLPADVESVDGIIAATYDAISGAAGEARDWDRFRSLFLPDAKLIPTFVRDDSVRHVYWSPDFYHSSKAREHHVFRRG